MADIISCGVYLFNNHNQLLLEHPTGHKSNIWTIPKGRMDAGETDYFEVAKRELQEETGVILNDLDIIKFEEFDIVRHRNTNKYIKSFFVKVNYDFDDFEFRCESMVYRNDVPVFPEVDDYRFVTIDEAKEILNEAQASHLDRCHQLLSEKVHIKKFNDY